MTTSNITGYIAVCDNSGIIMGDGETAEEARQTVADFCGSDTCDHEHPLTTYPAHQLLMDEDSITSEFTVIEGIAYAECRSCRDDKPATERLLVGKHSIHALLVCEDCKTERAGMAAYGCCLSNEGTEPHDVADTSNPLWIEGEPTVEDISDAASSEIAGGDGIVIRRLRDDAWDVGFGFHPTMAEALAHLESLDLNDEADSAS